MNIPAEAIDRIEVVRGPMSVIYGTGAFFGAINIFTNKVEDPNAVSQVSASVGSEKTYKMVARASGKEGDFQYAFNGSYFDTEGLDVKLSDLVSNSAILPAYGVSQDSTKGQLESMDKYFNFSGKFKGFSFDTSYSEAEYESYITLPSVSDGTLIRSKAIRINFGYAHKFSDIARIDASIGYFLNRWTFDYDYLFSGIYSFQSNSASGYRAELNLFFDPSPNVNVAIGVSYDKITDAEVEVDIPLFAFNNYLMKLSEGESMITQAVYAQLNLKLSNRFKIVAGARLEQVPEYQLEDTYNRGLEGENTNVATYSQTSVEFIPRLALIWGINDNNYIKLLYGQAINRPSFFQSRDLLVYPTSTPLEPEKIQTFELNYIANLSPKFTVNLSLFHNILEKLIYRTFFSVGGTIVSYFDNVGEITTNGAELTLQFAPSKSFFLELSGTYQDTQDERPGFEDIAVGYSPKVLGYLKASYFFNKDISIAVSGNYVGKMESYYDDTLADPRRLGDEVDSYFVLGANLRLRNLFGTGLFLNVRGSNLLDQEIRYPTTSNSTWTDRGFIGKGMSFLLTLGYKFMPIP
jgi:outer membrane cobalamin receptor